MIANFINIYFINSSSLLRKKKQKTKSLHFIGNNSFTSIEHSELVGSVLKLLQLFLRKSTQHFLSFLLLQKKECTSTGKLNRVITVLCSPGFNQKV